MPADGAPAPLRVLMVLESDFTKRGGGGAESQVRTVAQHLRLTGNAATVITPLFSNSPPATAERCFGITVPAWRRGLPSEVLRYFILHRTLIPQRSPAAAQSSAYDAVMRARLEPLGAEFISASDVFCNAQGCLTRIGDAAADITVSDQVHITEKGSIFLIASIIDRLLSGAAPASKAR